MYLEVEFFMNFGRDMDLEIRIQIYGFKFTSIFVLITNIIVSLRTNIDISTN